MGLSFTEETMCDAVRFIASGREDIDVRMLGNGRPFVLQVVYVETASDGVTVISGEAHAMI